MHRNFPFPAVLHLRRKAVVIIIMMMAAVPLYAQWSTAKPDIKEYTLTSKVLNQKRKITIYRPPVLSKYSESVSPVFYVLDGEFSAFYYCTLVNYCCQRMPGLPPITVVGIENEPSFITESGGTNSIGRNRDFTPIVARDSTFYKTSGGAEKFLQFINEELVPFVEKDYKKMPYRVFAGNSLGGWLVMHTFLKHPGMFNAYIATSPAMQMDKSAYMQTVEETILNATERNNRLFFSVGNEPDPYLPNARKIDSLLKNKNFKGLTYRFTYYPKEGHSTLKAMQDGFQYIFRMEELPVYETPLSNITYSKFEDHYKNLSQIFGYAMKPDEGMINSYGYYLLNSAKDVDRALEFFKKNVENYPQSANVYDSYAEALLVKGDKENALINYEKAFAMDPTNTGARDIIIELRKGK
ncbi:alpha/beta hydrolase-fold protein [Chitinophagaceae bacterium LB-8]|uniref:Alpha/beta hydrolase-fold protein n=1 Tax=Paraflavisolibacter caeni TaxID=2982496 RepID=A0A9X3BFJ6_9BACT|nr:alpha/beta hydrolase-fold protein [Paraflavisolibacter caeni]MCU7549009.1 alpha/beta hydrolase-fold protein [Paraflavisolibacter caeni]